MANGSFQIDFSRAFVSHEIPGVLLNLLQIARIVSQPHYRGAQKNTHKKKSLVGVCNSSTPELVVGREEIIVYLFLWKIEQYLHCCTGLVNTMLLCFPHSQDEIADRWGIES